MTLRPPLGDDDNDDGNGTDFWAGGGRAVRSLQNGNSRHSSRVLSVRVRLSSENIVRPCFPRTNSIGLADERAEAAAAARSRARTRLL